MNRLSTEQRKRIVSALVEGNSIRATCRMTGASKATVMKLLLDLGTMCSAYQDRALRDLDCKRLEIDEIWTFVYAKKKNVPAELQGQRGIGDVWTWVALDAETKLVPSYLVGERNADDAVAFVADLASRMRHRVQVSSDGHHLALLAMRNVFRGDVDYATVWKQFANASKRPPWLDPETRYSPGQCIGLRKDRIAGDPDMDKASTSYVERQNLTMRMGMRRFTRLTNAFSKKVENHAAAVALHFAYYNLCRVHKTLGTTPAVAAGVADHVWTLGDLIGLLEQAEAAKPTKRGPYRKTRERQAADSN
jgi:IS1 family transposase